MPNFASEVDNTVGVAAIKNMIIGPIFDSKGVLKGIIQLINKVDNDPITESDERELSSLLPIIGEIIKTADQVKLITNISSGVDEYLCTNEDIIVQTAEQLKEKSMQPIANSIKFIQDNLDNMIESKETFAFQDKKLAAELLQTLRAGEKEAKVAKQRQEKNANAEKKEEEA